MRTLPFVSALGLGTLVLVSACNSSEATADTDHTPTRVVLTVGATAMTDTLFLPAGQTVTVRGTFYNSADDNLDDVETEHWSRLTFTPVNLATASVDSAHHYSHTVQVQGASGSTGSVDIGFGHDVLADEHSLSMPVKIVP